MKTRLNLKAGYLLNYSLLNYLKGDITRTTRIKNLYTQIGIVSHMMSRVDPLVIFSKAKLEPTLTPKLKIHQF